MNTSGFFDGAGQSKAKSFLQYIRSIRSSRMLLGFVFVAILTQGTAFICVVQQMNEREVWEATRDQRESAIAELNSTLSRLAEESAEARKRGAEVKAIMRSEQLNLSEQQARSVELQKELQLANQALGEAQKALQVAEVGLTAVNEQQKEAEKSIAGLLELRAKLEADLSKAKSNEGGIVERVATASATLQGLLQQIEEKQADILGADTEIVRRQEALEQLRRQILEENLRLERILSDISAGARRLTDQVKTTIGPPPPMADQPSEKDAATESGDGGVPPME